MPPPPANPGEVLWGRELRLRVVGVITDIFDAEGLECYVCHEPAGPHTLLGSPVGTPLPGSDDRALFALFLAPGDCATCKHL